MAKEIQGKIKKSYRSPISRDLTVYSVKLAAHDISDWQNAINMAKSAINPRRKALYTLYENIMLDGHLMSVVEKRSQRLTNKKIVFDPKGKDGETLEWMDDKIMETPWFYNLNKLGNERVPYGHSLVELIPKNGLIQSVEPINRINVRPEDEFMQFSYHSYEDGIHYKEDPYYSRYLLSFGGKKDYGRLMAAAQYAIYKRGGFGDWAQFAELFGMPFRIGKYNPYDNSTQQTMKQALAEMGGAGFAVIPEGTSLEFHSTNSSGQSDIYKLLIEACNAEMSKIFLGQTMTTEDGSSHSQSETHRIVENDIILSDMIEREYSLNWELKPKLQALGYPIPEGRFRFEMNKELPREKLIEIAMKVSEKVPIADEWWYETFGIAKPSPEELKAKLELKEKPVKEDPSKKDQPSPPDDSKGNPPAPPKNSSTGKKPKAKIIGFGAVDKLYAQVHNQDFPTPENITGPIDQDIIDRIIKGLHNGSIRPGEIDPELYLFIKESLWKGVVAGFGGDLSDFDNKSADAKMLKLFKKNVQIFSGFKTESFLKLATDLLTEKGNIRPFGDFKKDILELHKTYNVNYLKTEYNMAIAQGQMGSIWAEAQRDKELFPYLRIETVGDDHTRPSHMVRDGITLPAGHEYWKKNWPPFGWGCRCTIKKLRRADVTNEAKLNDIPDLPDDFANNVGVDGTIFPKSHPYFQESKMKKMKAQVNKIEKDAKV